MLWVVEGCRRGSRDGLAGASSAPNLLFALVPSDLDSKLLLTRQAWAAAQKMQPCLLARSLFDCLIRIRSRRRAERSGGVLKPHLIL
jgi:hypothetical protein